MSKDTPEVFYPSPDPVLNPDAPDVPRKTLKTLADWALELSKSKQSKSPPGTNSTNISNNTYTADVAEGTNPAIVSMGQKTPGNADKKFSDEFGSSIPTLPRYQPGHRGVGDPNATSGHELLGSATTGESTDVGSGLSETNLEPQMDNYVQTPILKRNKWTVGATRTANDSIRVKGIDRTKNEMTNVGVTLTTRASSELGSSDSSYDTSSGTAEAKAILPGWTQMGAKRVDLAEFDVLSALNKGVDGPIEESVAPGGSWGQMNNPLDQYSGLSAFGMAALSVALFVSVTVVVKAFNTALGLVMKSNGPSQLTPEEFRDGERLFPGQFGPRRNDGGSSGFPPIPLDKNTVANLLGIRMTMFNWSDAVEAGMLAFYGSDKTRLSQVLNSGDISSMLSRAVESPGYYSVVSRGIIRSGVEIVDKLKDMVKSPNLVSGIKNLIGFFDVIKSSKFMSAMNAFASIGENALRTQASMYKVSDSGRVSGLDVSQNTIASNTKNRLLRSVGSGPSAKQVPTLKLAWASNRAISILNTPNVLRGTFLQAITNEAPASLIGASSDPMSRTINSHVDGRLPSEVVEYIESILDYEYVPFYFHDIRTNEIISFHAFIASISDDFSPSWETVEGYGRVDPVKIYKNTSRKIGLSFYMVSTSQADFDEMWVKINKLVTLVYPQYTQGRVVQDKTTGTPDYRFTLPFSQIPSASPLVRIRLGDLFRSNYSKFALARLFGMGSVYTSSTPEENLIVNKQSFLTSKLKGDEEQKLSEISRWTENFEKLKSAGVVFLVSSANLTESCLVDSGNMSSSVSSDVMESFQLLKMSGIPIPVTLESEYTPGQFYKVKIAATHPRIQKYVGLPDVQKYLSTISESAQILASVSEMMLPPAEISAYVSGGTDADAGAKATEFQNFMNEENNALVKSFKETGGKGLAGVIESLSFDWYDRVLWETEIIGSKAPKMCKVSITFSPIHDISPGLDSNGYNRSAVYPVGSNEGKSTSIQPPRQTLSTENIKNSLGSSATVSSDVNNRKA